MLASGPFCKFDDSSHAEREQLVIVPLHGAFSSVDMVGYLFL